MKKELFILSASIMMYGCNGKNNKDTNSYDQSLEHDIASTTSSTAKKNIEIFDVIKNSDLYSEPNDKSNKLINQKATKALGEVHYLSIDKSCKVIIKESNGDWSKIQVVEPDWLITTHIGWVKNNVLKYPKNEIEDLTKYAENHDFQILFSKNVGGTTNYHILLLWEKFDENKLEKLAKFIKREKSPKNSCNISIYDSKDIVSLIDVYPLKGKDYVKFADHFVYMLSFDGMTMYYPYKDALYKEYGGKKPIR